MWRYEASGGDPGAAWVATNYNDSTWTSGLGLFAFEEMAAVATNTHTTLPLTGTNGAPITTWYFRTQFQYDGSLKTPFLILSNIVDDGVVFYLNGSEIARFNMSYGLIRSTNLASSAAQEGVYQLIEKRATNLVIGDNVLAVEVHQQSTNSADVVFGVALFVDATTNAGTMNYDFESRPNNFVRSATLLTNGQFLLGGGFRSINSNSVAGLARIDRLGRVDETFRGGTNLILTNGLNIDVHPSLVDGGKIYAGGSFIGPLRTNVARLNWDGSLDTTFVPAVPNGRVRAVVPQPDGKVIIAGEFTAVAGSPRGYIARLNSDGSLDTNFANASGFDGRVRTVALLDDQKILVAGLFTSFDGAPGKNIVRLTASGTRDNTFGIGQAGADGEV